jgi:hypothetical protein
MQKLKEDVAYGIYDRPGPGIEDGPAAMEDPIVAGPQMSVQLSTEKPPIDDEDYAPTSSSALSLAAAEIAALVPDDQIRFFYKALHRLLDKSTDRTTIPGKEKEMQEENLKKSIKNVLMEIISNEDQQEFDDFRYGKDEKPGGVDYFGEEKPIQDQQSAKRDDKSNLDSLAKEFGFSGPSGARQYVKRILKRMGFMADILDDTAVESLMGMAVPEFISTMQEGDYIDEEDVADLKSAPSIVRDLPSYKYFFVSGFILPAYREFMRSINNNVRKSVENSGIPKSLHDTVFNQATGLADKDPQAIRQKLKNSIDSGEITAGDFASVFKAAREIAFSTKEKPAAEDFTELATDKWQSLSRSRRQTILKKALEETLEGMK